MKNKSLYQVIFTAVLFLFLPACSPAADDANAACSERDVLFCEDFENLAGDLGGSQFLQSSLLGRWWVTGDDEGVYLFQDFPVNGRSRRNMILLGDGAYADLENSLLYTAELDLENIETATLTYNIIYRTEEHWDGMVIFAIQGGTKGVGDGENWIVLTPENGYPDTVFINGTLFPGYSGITSIWLSEKIDLTPVLGKKTILGFYFSSDDQIGDWGAALDDIAVSIDADLEANLTSPAINISDLDLKLSPGTVVTPLIPRANLIADSSCEGSPEVLAEGQRAYIKGLNESGDKALVLHPDTGRFCWVSLESIWIDGDTGELARLSDLKPEDYYLPICAASFTPELTGSTCLTQELDQELPAFQLQTALVEEGIIQQIILSPVSIADAEFGVSRPDPRISWRDADLVTGVSSPPGGLLWAEIEGGKVSCYPYQEQTGTVVCQGAAIDAGGPVQLNLCWQAFGNGQACPPGYGSLPRGGCGLLVDLDGCVPACPPGYAYSAGVGLCLLDRDPAGMEDDPDLCPQGMSVLSEAGCCGSAQPETMGICPEGYFFEQDQASCQALPLDGSCPDLYQADPLTGVCYLPGSANPPLCTAVEAEFPIYEVSVRETTRCYKSPDKINEIVSSLKPFTMVEVIGLGEDGTTLVLNNPDYQIPCWASLSDFYTENMNLGILPVIHTP